MISRAMEDAAARAAVGALAGHRQSAFFDHRGIIDSDAVAALGAGAGWE
jgi:hypothetical protein